MKVLHVISSLDPRTGGPAVALKGLIRAQRSNGMEVAVFSTWIKGVDLSTVEELRQDGIEVHLLTKEERST